MTNHPNRSVRANPRYVTSPRSDDQRIARIIAQRCPDAHVSWTDIGKVYFVGYDAITEGVDDQTLIRGHQAPCTAPG